MIKVHRDIVPLAHRSTLLEYAAQDDDRVDQRPDVRSKHPRWNQDKWPQSVIQLILDHVLPYEYDVEEVIFNDSRISFRLHADSGDGTASCLTGSGVLIPLWVQGQGATAFFSNHWHHASTKFSREHIPDYEYTLSGRDGAWIYVQDLRQLLTQCETDAHLVTEFDVTSDFLAQLRELIAVRSKRDGRCYDYSGIENYRERDLFPDNLYHQHFSHIPKNNLNGLTVEQIVPWYPGDVMVFPRTQLHCATAGHSRKIGVTVFTRRR